MMFSRAHLAWRLHPWMQQRENLKHMLPGFGTAAAIFGAYMVLEQVYYRTLGAERPVEAPATPTPIPMPEAAVATGQAEQS